MSNSDAKHFIQTISFNTAHLSHAIELLRMAGAVFDSNNRVRDELLRHRFAMSSIIHAFSGLESSINFFGFELFFNAKSKRFVPNERRSFLLSRMIKTWDRVPAIEKLSFVLSHSGNPVLAPRIENELRELNNLRNWLVHGFSYKKTLLAEPHSDEHGFYMIVGTSDSVDWREKFPNTKFKPLDKLDADDARLALKIVFAALKLLSDSMNEHFVIITCEPDMTYTVLQGDSPDMTYTVLQGDSFNEKVNEMLTKNPVRPLIQHLRTDEKVDK